LSFNCSLNSGTYEYVRFKTDTDIYLEYETKNYYEESGYFVMHAEDSAKTKVMDMILPEEEYLNIIYIPYDNISEIKFTDNTSSKTYSASNLYGTAEVMFDSKPDSSLSELSGSFSGKLVNIDDITDTLSITEGYFIFVY